MATPDDVTPNERAAAKKRSPLVLVLLGVVLVAAAGFAGRSLFGGEDPSAVDPSAGVPAAIPAAPKPPRAASDAPGFTDAPPRGGRNPFVGQAPRVPSAPARPSNGGPFVVGGQR